jgi:transposase InsO family protein
MNRNMELDPKEAAALVRFAAVNWIEQQNREGSGLSSALRAAALRPWPDETGNYYAVRTLEDWWYAYRRGGFGALRSQPRADSGQSRKVGEELGRWLIEQISAAPQAPLSVLTCRWREQGKALPSLSTIRRYLRARGYDRQSLRAGRLESGPTKAFEAPFVNDLWMVDFSPGPVLSVGGKAVATQLCLIVDDHSRLVPYAAYYERADTESFLATLREAVQRRGVPWKLYTDLGKPFVNGHVQVVCANLGIRLLHAKPYAAWSKGKVERLFFTVQQGFESVLRLPGEAARDREELNGKFSQWLQTQYHLRVHSATGMAPQKRYQVGIAAVRSVEVSGLELDRLFYTRLRRRVRKDGTVRLGGKLYEVELSLRALEVELRFDPFRLDRIEVHRGSQFCGLARRADLHGNSQTNGRQP